jgi:hypothetical protein
MYLLKGYICKSVPITGRLYIPDGPGILSNGLAAVTLDPVTIPLVWIKLLANILTSMIKFDNLNLQDLQCENKCN